MVAGNDMPGQEGPQIPVDDPDAALRFCRSVAQVLGSQEAPASSGKASAGTARPELSVVLPVYNEQENLILLHRRLTAVLDAEAISYEIVFVDDGSTDESTALLHKLSRERAARFPSDTAAEMYLGMFDQLIAQT